MPSVQKKQSSSTSSHNIAAAYIRVSTLEQRNGYSPSFQKNKAYEYAENNGLKLEPDLIFDDTYSASTTNNDYLDESLDASLKNRPELRKLLELAQLKKFSHLILYSRDRMTRSMEQALAINLLLSKNHVEVHYTRSGETVTADDDKINRFLSIILNSVSELESNILSNRVRDGMVVRLNNLYWPGGRPPFGYVLEKIDDKLSVLKPSIYEMSLVQEIFNLYTKGFGYRRIADLMNQNHKEDNIIWGKSKIESIIKNETYYQLTWGRRGSHRNSKKRKIPVRPEFNDKDKKMLDIIKKQQIINEDKWNEINNLSAKKQKIKDPKYFSTPFLLKGKLYYYDGNRKVQLVCKNYGKGKKSVYKTPNESGKKSDLIIPKDDVENKFIKSLDSILSFTSINEAWSLYENKSLIVKSDLENRITGINEKLEEIKNLRNNIEFMLDQEIEDDLKNLLTEKDQFLVKSIKYFEEESTKLQETMEKTFYSNLEEFQQALTAFNMNTFDKSPELKRMLIDTLIDEINVSVQDGNLELEILVNPPKYI